MRSILYACAAIIALAPGVSFADSAKPANDKVLTGPVPAWVSIPDPMPVPDGQRGMAFLREQDSEVHLDKDGQSSFQSIRVKILQPAALQLGNISIAWDPAAGAPTVHAVKIHRDGAVIDVLAGTRFEILRREDKLEQAMLSGILTAIMRVPDLRVGDELELSYTIRQQDPTLGPLNSGVLFLADNPTPGRIRMRLSWDKGQEPHIQMTPDLDKLVTRSAQAIEIDADMAPPANPPKDAPPRYKWQRILEYSDFGSWQDISRKFAPLYDKASRLDPKSPLKQEAARIAAAHSDPMERAAAALKLVQQQVRYIYVGLNNGNLTPANADDTWQRRYGDCKAKTAMLLALLHEMDIPAEAVLANNSGADDGLDQRLPSTGMFDHVLVRATIDGKSYWLDGTLPPVAPPSLDPALPYRWLLPLSNHGSALEQIPWKPASRPETVTLYEIDARSGFDKPAGIVSTTITRGPAALAAYYQFSAVTDEQLEAAFRQNSEGGSAWNTIDKVSWRFDVPTQSSVLVISGTGPVDWDKDGDDGHSLTLPGGGFYSPERRQRGTGQDQAAPYYNKPDFNCYVTTVRLPSDTKTEDWNYNTSFVTSLFGKLYRRAFQRGDGEITMLRESRVFQDEISAEQAAKDNNRIDDFDNSKADITYSPGSDSVLLSPEIVPTTYGNDWVANDRACVVPLKKDK